jgi:hypothetical protein
VSQQQQRLCVVKSDDCCLEVVDQTKGELPHTDIAVTRQWDGANLPLLLLVLLCVVQDIALNWGAERQEAAVTVERPKSIRQLQTD